MIEPTITDFITEQKVASLACAEGGKPYCFNCYYSFLEKEGLLIYKSSFNTRHEQILKENKNLAGTIIPEQIELSTLRGVQFTGVLLEDDFERTIRASSSYYLRFPFAFAVPGKIYCVEMQEIKFTDNGRGFGFKQHWKR